MSASVVTEGEGAEAMLGLRKDYRNVKCVLCVWVT